MPAKSSDTAEAEPLVEGNVWCRITKKGDNRIFSGETVPNPLHPGTENYSGPDVFPRHKYGEIVQFPKAIAEAQEENGYLEIQV